VEILIKKKEETSCSERMNEIRRRRKNNKIEHDKSQTRTKQETV